MNSSRSPKQNQNKRVTKKLHPNHTFPIFASMNYNKPNRKNYKDQKRYNFSTPQPKIKCRNLPSKMNDPAPINNHTQRKYLSKENT